MMTDIDISRFLPVSGGIGVRIDGPCSGPLGDLSFRLSAEPEGGSVSLAVDDALRESFKHSKFLVFDVYHEQPYTLGVLLNFSGQPGNSRESIHVTLGVLPGLITRLSFPLSALDGQTIFLPRTPGRLKGTCFGSRVDPAEISVITLGLPGATGDQTCWISSMYLTDVEPEYPIPEKAVVDEFGQWTAKEWNGKTTGESDLKASLAEGLKAAESAAFPQSWSHFGGWLERNFGGTGFFRTHHDGRRWWLVDPEGYAFFSTGLDCVRPHAECLAAGNENLLSWLPPNSGSFTDAWSGGRAGRMVNFTISNAIRAWGADKWYDNWSAMTRGRLLDWGFNTVANWSDPRFYLKSKIPYVWQPGGFPSTERTIYRDFPDVFSDEYTLNAKTFAEGLLPYINDQYMIGYFMRNEPHWAFGENNIAEYLLEAGNVFASADRLVGFLKDRYNNDITRLSAAWSKHFSNFDSILGTSRGADLSEAAAKDLWDFTAIMVRQYLKVVVDACKAADPNHLNLGIRYAWLSSDAVLAGADLCDVFSINMYQMAPNAEVIQKASEASGKPVIIGEYHWGALDVGLPSTGLKAVPDQKERGKAYKYYLENGAALPWLVGAHYFTLYDQPVLGRFDGENFQIGFADICHKPYWDLITAVKQTHDTMYKVADGQLVPTAEAPKELPRQGF